MTQTLWRNDKDTVIFGVNHDGVRVVLTTYFPASSAHVSVSLETASQIIEAMTQIVATLRKETK